jgi:hypothetical protein
MNKKQVNFMVSATVNARKALEAKDLPWYFHMGLKPSSNSKTGKIFVTTSDERTCPDSCPLKFILDVDGKIVFDKAGNPVEGPCYAKSGFHLKMHWAKVSNGERGGDFASLLDRVKALAPNELWRHNQAGDLPGENEKIDYAKLTLLILANGDSKGFTYTHKKKAVRTKRGLKALQTANSKGFTINISADNDAEVDEFRALGLPVTVVIAEDSKGYTTAGGNKIKVCPAQLSDRKLPNGEFVVTCKSCGLCNLADRPHVVGFRTHGTKKAAAMVQLDLG